MQLIDFSCSLKGFIPEPKPSLQFIPEGYKKMQRYFENKVREDNKTVKMCMPFLDALTVGYIIPFPADMNCFYDKDEVLMNFELSQTIPLEFQKFFGVEAHADNQITKDLRYNRRTVEAIFKFKNPWTIKTPPGYSCLFTNPLNQNTNFKIIDGIVDTDTYDLPVQFPFYWTLDSEKQCVLEKGAPMVQIIPFKRESWKSTVSFQSPDTKKEHELRWGTLFQDVYKKLVWKKKSFK